jgi:hypothetical protein
MISDFHAESSGMPGDSLCDVLQPENPEPFPGYFLGKRIHSVLPFPFAYETVARRNAKGHIEIG